MAMPVQFASATANNNTVSLVAAVAGQRVKVLSYYMDVNGAATGTIRDISSTVRVQATNIAAVASKSVHCAGTREAPLWATAVGNGVEVVSSAAVNVVVTIAYIQDSGA